MEKLVINTRKTEGGYCASCERIEGWVVGFSGSFADFKGYVRESIGFWLEGEREENRAYDPIFDGEYELQFKYDAQNLLENIGISYSALERITGINQKQLSHYAQGVKKPRMEQVERIAEGLRRFGQELGEITM